MRIDFTPLIDEIRARYGITFRNLHTEGTKKLIETHGGDRANDCGVFTGCDELDIVRFGKSYATARLALTRRGYYFVGYNHVSGHMGECSGPTVWNRYGYTVRDEALAAAQSHAFDFFSQQVRRSDSSVTDICLREARCCLELLAAARAPRQLTLFDEAMA